MTVLVCIQCRVTTDKACPNCSQEPQQLSSEIIQLSFFAPLEPSTDQRDVTVVGIAFALPLFAGAITAFVLGSPLWSMLSIAGVGIFLKFFLIPWITVPSRKLKGASPPLQLSAGKQIFIGTIQAHETIKSPMRSRCLGWGLEAKIDGGRLIQEGCIGALVLQDATGNSIQIGKGPAIFDAELLKRVGENKTPLAEKWLRKLGFKTQATFFFGELASGMKIQVTCERELLTHESIETYREHGPKSWRCVGTPLFGALGS